MTGGARERQVMLSSGDAEMSPLSLSQGCLLFLFFAFFFFTLWNPHLHDCLENLALGQPTKDASNWRERMLDVDSESGGSTEEVHGFIPQ